MGLPRRFRFNPRSMLPWPELLPQIASAPLSASALAFIGLACCSSVRDHLTLPAAATPQRCADDGRLACCERTLEEEGLTHVGGALFAVAVESGGDESADDKQWMMSQPSASLPPASRTGKHVAAFSGSALHRALHLPLAQRKRGVGPPAAAEEAGAV